MSGRFTWVEPVLSRGLSALFKETTQFPVSLKSATLRLRVTVVAKNDYFDSNDIAGSAIAIPVFAFTP